MQITLQCYKNINNRSSSFFAVGKTNSLDECSRASLHKENTAFFLWRGRHSSVSRRDTAAFLSIGMNNLEESQVGQQKINVIHFCAFSSVEVYRFYGIKYILNLPPLPPLLCSSRWLYLRERNLPASCSFSREAWSFTRANERKPPLRQVG